MFISLDDLVQRWLHDLKADHTATTLQRYSSVLERFQAWYLLEAKQPLTLADLNPIVLVGYRNALQQSDQPNTVNVHVSALRAFGQWLNQAEHLEQDPAARLKFVKRSAPTAPRALTPSQVNALLRETQHGRYPARDYAIVQMLVQTGIRIGECVTLQWEDISFGEKQGQILIRSGKGNQARHVPLNGSVRQALADYVAPMLQTNPTLKAVMSAWMQHPKGRLWQSQKGSLTLVSIDRLVKNLMRACAARDLIDDTVTPHALRHTFATRYLMAHPGDLVGLARLLGHSSLDATKIYVQPTAQQLADRVEAIDLNAY